MSFLSRTWQFMCRHKYVVTIVLFLVLICFVDQNNLIVRQKNKSELRRLESELEYYTARCDSLQHDLDDLEKGGYTLERIAREQYGMHKSDEEVFLIPEKKKR